jgi:hypothetical protein
MNETVKLARYRSGEYTVNYDGKRYYWVGSKNGIKNIVPVPKEVYDWLLIGTRAIATGELVPVEDEAKEQLSYTENVEEVMKNVHTEEEIEKILTGNYKAMEKQLKEITNKDEKDFVLQVAKKINIDSASKRQFIVEWVGIKDFSTDEVFLPDEE